MSAPEQFTELPPIPNPAGPLEQQFREILEHMHRSYQVLERELKDHKQRLANIAVANPTAADIIAAAASTIEE